jgi:hypothetical protein
MAASVHAAETSLAQQFLLLVLVDDLPRVKVASLVIVIQDVVVTQVYHIIVMQEQTLGRVHSTSCRTLELELVFQNIDELINCSKLHA